MNSALYFGRVRHRRRAPVKHGFEYRMFMVYLDLDEIDRAFDGRVLWSASRPAPVRFRRADYLGDPAEPLAASVRRVAAGKLGRAFRGPIRMLTNLRTWGYVQNPVTFYFLFDETGTVAECVLAEITNTPWGERHVYAVARDRALGLAGDFDKEFHVSPFMGMRQRYSWEISDPGERIEVAMRSTEGGAEIFEASLDLRRAPLDGRNCAKALALHPWLTAKVLLGIYWQALRLKLKRAPFHPHPKTLAGRAGA